MNQELGKPKPKQRWPILMHYFRNSGDSPGRMAASERYTFEHETAQFVVYFSHLSETSLLPCVTHCHCMLLVKRTINNVRKNAWERSAE